MRFYIKKAERKDFEAVYKLLSANRKRLGSWCTNRSAIYKWLYKGCIDCLEFDGKIRAVKIQSKKRIYSLASSYPGAGLRLLHSSPKGSIGLISTRNKPAQRCHILAGFKIVARLLLCVKGKPKYFYLMQKEV